MGINYNGLHMEVLRVKFEVLVTVENENLSATTWRCVFPFPWRSTLHFVSGLLFRSEKECSRILKISVNFYQTKRSYIPKDDQHNSMRTSHLIKHKLTSVWCYSCYSNWRRCRISQPILASLCTYFHEFSQYFSEYYYNISRIFHFFASAHWGWGDGRFSRQVGTTSIGNTAL